MRTFEKEPGSEYTIRFQDCDPMGHLNNARFIDYVLNAREDHLHTYYQLNISDYLKKGLGWLVAGHEILYKRPALYNERVFIKTALLSYSESDLLVEGLVMDKNQTHLKALVWSRYVFINIRDGKKEQHPNELLQVFSAVCLDAIALQSAKNRLQQVSEILKTNPKLTQ